MLAAPLLFIIIMAWLIFGAATKFNEKSKYIYVREGADAKQQVLDQLSKDNLIRNTVLFNFIASQLNIWQRLKPGRFEIKKGESIFNIAGTLRSNSQSPVKLVIKKIRTNEDFARLVAKNFSVDSSKAILFFKNNDSLQAFGVDSSTLTSLIIPDTYLFNWNTSPKNILMRLQKEENNFWSKNNRLQKAESAGLAPLQVYIIASIVEEETNKKEEKGNVASVYINRLNKGMQLAADPTIKFALRDFNLKRILFVHLSIESPYNTYRNKGLPPGPICTPSPATIDAVLDAPKTDYLFFVAKSDFSGYHHFSNNYAEHVQYAKQYQQALDNLIIKKQEQNQ